MFVMGITTSPARRFVSAFKALPSIQRSEILARLAKDRAVREDLIDLAVAETRRHEPTRPFRKFLAENESVKRRR